MYNYVFHVSDNIFWGLCITFSATIWNTRPLAFLCRYGGESLVIATIVPDKNLPLPWPPHPAGNARRLLRNNQTAPASGALGWAASHALAAPPSI